MKFEMYQSGGRPLRGFPENVDGDAWLRDSRRRVDPHVRVLLELGRYAPIEAVLSIKADSTVMALTKQYLVVYSPSASIELPPKLWLRAETLRFERWKKLTASGKNLWKDGPFFIDERGQAMTCGYVWQHVSEALRASTVSGPDRREP